MSVTLSVQEATIVTQIIARVTEKGDLTAQELFPVGAVFNSVNRQLEAIRNAPPPAALPVVEEEKKEEVVEETKEE